MNRPLRFKLIGGFLVVFIAGLVAGAFLGALHARHHRTDFSHHEALTERIRNRMQTRLALTPEQLAKTAPIFDKTARQIEDIRKETSRRVHETFAAADDELAPALTPEQRARLDALEAEKSQTPVPLEQASR
jgi:uncharacterized membrane-anchored protein YhcB (DUF1043 family)